MTKYAHLALVVLGWSGCAPVPVIKPGDAREARAKEANAKVEELVEDGRYADALKLAEENLKACERELGPGHGEVGEALTNLGAAKFYLGDHLGALTLMERALAVRRSALGEEHPLVAESLSNLASVHLATGQRDRAMPLYERALALRKRLLGPDDPAVGESLIEMGLAVHQGGDTERAIRMYEKAIAIWEAALGPKDRKVAQGSFWLGQLLEGVGQHQRARSLYERAWAIEAGLLRPAHPERLAVMTSLANLWMRLGNVQGARELYTKLLAIQEETLGKDHQDLVDTLTTTASLIAQTGGYTEASSLYERALRLIEKHLGEGHLAAGVCRAYLADCDLALNELEAALSGYRKALSILETAAGKEHPWVAYCLYGQGRVLTELARLGEARSLLVRSLDMVEKALGPEHPQGALVLTALGYVEMLASNFRESRVHYEKALRIQEKIFGPEHPQVAGVLLGLGQLARRTGGFADAIEAFRRALAITQASYGDVHIQSADVVSHLGEIALHQADPHKAAKLYDQALEIYVHILGREHPRVIAAIHNFAHALAMAGQYEDALEHYRYVLTKYTQTLGPDHPWTSQAKCTTALILSFADQAEAALPLCQEGLKGLARALGESHFRIAENLRCLVLSNLRLGKLEAARQAADRTLALASSNVDPLLDILSERERMLLIGTRRVYLDTYLSLFDGPGDGRRAYDSVLQWKSVGINLLAAQHEAVLASKNPATKEALADLRRVRRQLAEHLFRESQGDGEANKAWLLKVLELSEEREALERRLTRSSEDIRRNRFMLKADAREVCRGLQKDEALVDFLVHHRYVPPARGEASEGRWTRRYLAFVLRPGSCGQPERIDLGEADVIDRAVYRFLQAVTQARSPKRLLSLGRRLRQLIWDPLPAWLGERRKIWIVPDAMLTHVAFGALVDEDERFLIEAIAFGYLSAAQELVKMRAGTGKRTGAEDVLIAGGIDYGAGADSAVPPGEQDGLRASLGPNPARALPETEAEANHVADLIQRRSRRGKVVLLKGPAATEERIKQELHGKRIIHLATHGFFAVGTQGDVSQIMDFGEFQIGASRTFNAQAVSGLLLAGVNQRRAEPGAEDGLLTAEEVSSLDLRGTRLVTLSACESGSGTAVEGEGVLGLRRAFTIAGAQAVVMSLWKVPDEPTRKLMELFYRRVTRSGHLDMAEALRQAKLSMIAGKRRQKQPVDPRAWAAFVVTGR